MKILAAILVCRLIEAKQDIVGSDFIDQSRAVFFPNGHSGSRRIGRNSFQMCCGHRSGLVELLVGKAEKENLCPCLGAFD
jgi:hypothetical protein